MVCVRLWFEKDRGLCGNYAKFYHPSRAPEEVVSND